MFYLDLMELYAYVGLVVAAMSFFLAIIGFLLGFKKTRVLAILYCIFGLLTFILAFVVGSL